MLMANYLQRCLFKWKYVILIILIISAMAAVFSSRINRWLPDYALSYSNLIARQFQAKIYFGEAHYLFPNCIIFKNVKILNPEESPPMLQASRVIMKFPSLLFSSPAPVNYIVMVNLSVNYPVLKNYWAHHGKKIYTRIKPLPEWNIRLFVPDGKIYLKGPSPEDPIAFKTDFSLDQAHLNAHGFWTDKDRFDYELDGNIRDSGFDLDKLTLREGNSSLNLWGKLSGGNIDWKGYIFYEKFYILDIDGHLKIERNDIILKGLSFSIDGDAVEASGHCLKQNLFQCDADITYRRVPPHIDPQKPLESINLNFHAQNTLQGLFLTGQSDLNFLSVLGHPPSLQKVHLDFENLKALIVNGDFLKLRIQHMQSIFSAQGNKYKISLSDLWASLNYSKPYRKNITLSSGILTGHCQGRIFLDTASFPWQIKSQGSFKGIDINLLSSTFSYLTGCHGLLSGSFMFQSFKNAGLTGDMAIHDGNFDTSSFQKWMAKVLQMPSLVHSPNTNLSCHFKIDRQSKMLDKLTLHSDDLDLNGFFNLDADDLVSSRISVRFSKKLLKESLVGREIISLVHGAWTLPIEFSLSGNVHRMNFQWDNSPLKDKVRQHMFSYFEQVIDQRMDAKPDYNVTIPNESVPP
ncbi:MAG: hypothetical protein HQL12_02315 [Candidatus Omnitrophica bacterium]|nr:hypothetical protein [Candidatus Omnitrophota bacterium]